MKDMNINIKEDSKSFQQFIDKISSAFGGSFKPYQMVRIAKAEAKVNLIKAKNKIKVAGIENRAVERFIDEEVKKQQNIENIIKKASQTLDENSNPENMDDDWITNFFDKSRIIADEEMQQIWAKVLSGEANSPGSFSKRTVNLLNDLDKKDAELLQALCRFVWNIGNDFTPIVIDSNNSIYNNVGITFESLLHLDDLGLIQFHKTPGVGKNNLPNSFLASYQDEELNLVVKNQKEELELGEVTLSKTGSELFKIIEVSKVDGFYEYVKNQWINHSPEIRKMTPSLYQ
jgi:uncharacterized repeat protein (TIGR03899 family)